MEEQCQYLGELLYSLRIVIRYLEYIEDVGIYALKILKNIDEILFIKVSDPFAYINGHETMIF